jgi:hydrogenase small subunit
VTQKPKLIWLQGATCNGNSHAFFNYPHLEALLDEFDLLHHPMLPTPVTLDALIRDRSITCDILLFEGSVIPDFPRGDTTVEKLLRRFDGRTDTVIAAGTCASFGGIFAVGKSDAGGLLYRNEKALEKPFIRHSRVINLPGCPVHPQTIATLLLALKNGRHIVLDEMKRPREIYGRTVHQGCTRNEYFEWKIDTEALGQKEGCMFYEFGCRAPMTHGSCNITLWNEVGSKPRAGTPCFGCTEPSFPNFRFFQTPKNMSIPAEVPLGVSKRAYLTISGIAKTFSITRLKKRLLDD